MCSGDSKVLTLASNAVTDSYLLPLELAEATVQQQWPAALLLTLLLELEVLTVETETLLVDGRRGEGGTVEDDDKEDDADDDDDRLRLCLLLRLLGLVATLTSVVGIVILVVVVVVVVVVIIAV